MKILLYTNVNAEDYDLNAQKHPTYAQPSGKTCETRPARSSVNQWSPRPVSPTPTHAPRPSYWFLCLRSVAVETRAMATRRSQTWSFLWNRGGIPAGGGIRRGVHGAVRAVLSPYRARLPRRALLQGRGVPAAGRRAHVHPAAAGGLPQPW